VDFAENGSVISNLPEEGKQRVHTLILSLYYALSADTVAKELPLLDGALKITTPDFISLALLLDALLCRENPGAGSWHQIDINAHALVSSCHVPR
jgi:hypothetical protein